MCVLLQDKCPHLPVFDVFYRFYPYKLFLGKEGQTAVEDILRTFNILDASTKHSNIARRVNANEKTNDSLNVTIEHGNVKTTLNVSDDRYRQRLNDVTFQRIFFEQVPCGTKTTDVDVKNNKYVETNYQNNLLTSMLESHLVSDLCLIGPKGCGKSTTVQTLADLLGYEIEPVVLYQASVTYLYLICPRVVLARRIVISLNEYY